VTVGLPRTPSQTVGPFFAMGLCDRAANVLPDGDVPVRGRVLDGGGDGVPDAMVELWHPDVGFGRAGTDAAGAFEFVVRPAPHYEVMVFARGLLKQVVTRMYFPDGLPDGVLGSLPEERRATLVADREPDGSLRFDIHLQGERETVFFAL
jgi:protocatechuate 3,4-dioxygenase, alpha subunit